MPADHESPAGPRVTRRRVAVIVAGAVAAVLVYQRAAPRIDDAFWAVSLAIAIPGLCAGGVWLLREGLRQRRDRRALAALGSGGQLQDGEWVAVAGVARAVGRPFEETLSGRPALASMYRVIEKVPIRSRSSHWVNRRYSGWHMVPTVIETNSIRLRLRGFPDLFGLTMSPHGASNVGRLAKVATLPPGRYENAAHAGLLAEPRDELHIDWQLGEPQAGARIETKEWLLHPDEPVCVCGRLENGALLPQPSHPAGLPIYLGSAAQVLEQLRGESRVYLRLGAGALVLAAALGGWFLR